MSEKIRSWRLFTPITHEKNLYLTQQYNTDCCIIFCCYQTITPNSNDGSDHAWGGNQIVVGGAVNGGQFYGQYPELALGSSLDTGRGRFVPTTSVDEYVAELALWMGVSPSNLSLVLPNIGEFHNVVENGPPLGYMALDP